MPTVAIQPSLRSTQAVGAALLHQFARERFLEAGMDDELIRKAEVSEEIDQIAADILPDEESNKDESVSDISETSTIVNGTGTDQSVTNHSHLSHNGSARARNESSVFGEQFHSIAESMTTENNSTYHSLQHDQSRIATNIERMQSLPIMASYGKELRKIADEFAKSRQRQTLKEKASEVQLSDISKETFVLLLEELFKGGITRERIVALFFFCTDVVIKAATSINSLAQDIAVKLMRWSFSYIVNTVCRIVHDLGGWDDLLFRQLPYLLVNCCAVLGICVLAVCLHKTLRAS